MKTPLRPAAVALMLLSLLPVAGLAQLPAFPGAEGFGSFARDGREGRVIAVTTTAASGPGYLQAALEENGLRFSSELWRMGRISLLFPLSCSLTASPIGVALIDSNDSILLKNKAWRHPGEPHPFQNALFGSEQISLGTWDEPPGGSTNDFDTAAHGIRAVLKGESSRFFLTRRTERKP